MNTALRHKRSIRSTLIIAGASAFLLVAHAVEAGSASAASTSATSGNANTAPKPVIVGASATSVFGGIGAPPPPPRAQRRSSGMFTPHVERYIIPTESDHLGRQLATYYGPGFWGNRTACGTTLKRDTWGIAHRTLPCGTMVAIGHRGKRVVVPVIDRGPFSGASVDLTQQTSDYLGFTSRGTGHISLSVIERFRFRIERVTKP